MRQVHNNFNFLPIKGPCINNIGNFSGFLTHPSSCRQFFSTICCNFDQFFDPSQLPTSFMDDPKWKFTLFYAVKMSLRRGMGGTKKPKNHIT